MLAGLKEGQEKMSKSDPDSAIFMEDSEVLLLTLCYYAPAEHLLILHCVLLG